MIKEKYRAGSLSWVYLVLPLVAFRFDIDREPIFNIGLHLQIKPFAIDIFLANAVVGITTPGHAREMMVLLEPYLIGEEHYER